MESKSLQACDEFNRVYGKYKNTVFGIAMSYCKNEADAKDILQEVFLKFYREPSHFTGEEHLKAWLIRVAVNACKKQQISFWKKKTLPLDETLPFEDRRDTELFETLMSLPGADSLVLHLHYYEGYKGAEIADILHISEAAVKMRLSRARTRLKEKLKEEWADE